VLENHLDTADIVRDGDITPAKKSRRGNKWSGSAAANPQLEQMVGAPTDKKKQTEPSERLVRWLTDVVALGHGGHYYRGLWRNDDISAAKPKPMHGNCDPTVMCVDKSGEEISMTCNQYSLIQTSDVVELICLASLANRGTSANSTAKPPFIFSGSRVWRNR
jgi:hypothetical protein